MTLRSAHDVMSQLSALLRVKDGVAVYATLGRLAVSAIAAGDPRGRGQLMSDALVALITTGAFNAASPRSEAREPEVTVNVVVSDRVLLGMDDGRVEGGPTSGLNGQGLCEACNYAKAAPGWSARPRPGPRHTVRTTTPTGHTYTSRAPAAHEQALVPFRFVLAG